MKTIIVSSVGGNQFARARELHSPIVVSDACHFWVPSSTLGELDHELHIDNPERPGTLSCTCRAGQLGRPCWAMARVLDALAELRKVNVYVCRRGSFTREALERAASAVGPPLEATFIDGELALLKRSATPLAGMVLNLP